MPEGQTAERRSSDTPSVAPALTKNGYVRSERAEAEILSAWRLGSRELEEAFRVAETDPEHLSVEALVFFVRRELRNGDQRLAETLFGILISRAEGALRSMVRGVDDDARYDIQADVLADMTRLVLADDDSGDFLQSRFWLYLKRRAVTARTKWLRSKWSLREPTPAGDGEPSPAETADPGISPESRALIRDALGRLPPELRELVVLRHYEGWRVGDEKPDTNREGEPTLAERYGITPRGVRKRLAKATELLTRDQKD